MRRSANGGTVPRAAYRRVKHENDAIRRALRRMIRQHGCGCAACVRGRLLAKIEADKRDEQWRRHREWLASMGM